YVRGRVRSWKSLYLPPLWLVPHRPDGRQGLFRPDRRRQPENCSDGQRASTKTAVRPMADEPMADQTRPWSFFPPDRVFFPPGRAGGTGSVPSGGAFAHAESLRGETIRPDRGSVPMVPTSAGTELAGPATPAAPRSPAACTEACLDLCA